jgi:hypothetical protein
MRVVEEFDDNGDFQGIKRLIQGRCDGNTFQYIALTSVT